MWALSNSSLKNREGVDGRLILINDLALSISPIDFGIPSMGGLRTAEQQQQLFIDGKSNCDGYENVSLHQKGLALDFYAYKDGKASWDELDLALVAAAHLQAATMLNIRLEWGGLWHSFKDYPHIQLTS